MSIKDFLHAAVNDKPVAAHKAFSAAIETKVNDALSTREKEVSNQLFNGTVGEETIDEIDYSKVDKVYVVNWLGPKGSEGVRTSVSRGRTTYETEAKAKKAMNKLKEKGYRQLSIKVKKVER